MTLIYILWTCLFSSLGSDGYLSPLTINTSERNISEVVIKSTLSEQNDKVLVEIQLPASTSVGFELYDKDGSIYHKWHGQQLHTGRHQLSLSLPQLDSDRYILQILVGEESFKHLIFVPS